MTQPRIIDIKKKILGKNDQLAQDLRAGFAPGKLWQISAYGSWGAWVVANNPYAPTELLDDLAKSSDWQVRLFAANNPNTSAATVNHLEKDPVDKVRQAARKTLQKEP